MPVTEAKKMAEMSAGVRPTRFESGGDGLLAEFDGGLDPGVVGGAEAGEVLVDVEGEDEVAELDAAVGVEAVEEAGLFHPVLPAISECISDCCLGVAMRWICRAD
jgi:hypothetical protein